MKTRVFFIFVGLVTVTGCVVLAVHGDWLAATMSGILALIVPTLYKAATYE